MDNVQKLLVVAVGTLTTLLLVVGVQVLFIILDLRKSIKRLNSILEDAIIGGGLIRPEKLTGVLQMFKKKKKIKKRGQV